MVNNWTKNLFDNLLDNSANLPAYMYESLKYMNALEVMTFTSYLITEHPNGGDILLNVMNILKEDGKI